MTLQKAIAGSQRKMAEESAMRRNATVAPPLSAASHAREQLALCHAPPDEALPLLESQKPGNQLPVLQRRKNQLKLSRRFL
ncbi:hypothetical protein GUJ93_ZPchr0002g25951 [Zizania palustris]|uniref:Uncharacterized protein n=1 Tax=Zizania palustris TaxID=103762 RepID=A0A8J5V5J4_ZIZPA|nr:hypothetical protein GUJ93_ZPchr0002g25951 [Zizania palustris]